MNADISDSTAQVLSITWMVWYFRTGTLASWPWWKEKRLETKIPIKVLITELKENDSDKDKEKKNSSRETAEVDSIVPSELLETAGIKWEQL